MHPSRIAVFRALQLGDMLCAVPALRALRACQPKTHITLIGLPWASDFACRFNHYIDDFMPFPGAPGLPEQETEPERLAAFYDAARQRRFDLSIQLHGSGDVSNVVNMELGAGRTAGFVPSDQAADADYLPWPQQVPEIERCLLLLSHLGYASCGNQLEFPLEAADRAAAAALREKYHLRAGGYICLHPGARMLSRRWPITRFAAVARQLAARGWPIVLTGTDAETLLAKAFSEQFAAPFIDLCGRTSLGALAALIADSRLLLCNDTGVSHIAAALRTPSVVVACGSDVARWAPLDRRLHAVVADYPPCRPCMHWVCPIGHPCALAIDADQVAHVTLRLLAEENTYVA
ncbi:MAG TPA: glycosyltransferase family 9 protein [Burkholderiaceae bacterium]|nr:glycosyltransferase family 9 protein [Burkholderiaceae bacterium]